MEQEILKYLITQGVFAVLFVYLLFYVLRENSKREERYHNIIDELSKRLNKIDDVDQNVKDIKELLR